MENEHISRATLSYMMALSVAGPDLTNDQARHVEEIGKDFCNLMVTKYTNGQREHGGNLWDLTVDQLLDNAIDEAIDQVVYLLTIRRKRQRGGNQTDSVRG